MHLYVYYEVPVEAMDAVLARVRAMQAALRDGRLMRREPAGAGRQTWMEVYEEVDAVFEERLATAADAAGLAALAGPRHVERFVPFA